MTQKEAYGEILNLFGWTVVTGTARGRIGKVAKELVEAGATPEMIQWAPRAWKLMWGDQSPPTLTDTALASHWPEIHRLWDQKETARQRREQREQEEKARQERIDMEALPIEENRRRWKALMLSHRGQLVKEIN